jgi:hypothetical protein
MGRLRFERRIPRRPLPSSGSSKISRVTRLRRTSMPKMTAGSAMTLGRAIPITISIILGNTGIFPA